MSVTSSSRRGARLSAGDWVGLAAAPSFATLALLSGFSGGESCGAQIVDGMTVMYGLMAVFHLPAWMKLISRSEEA